MCAFESEAVNFKSMNHYFDTIYYHLGPVSQRVTIDLKFDLPCNHPEIELKISPNTL